MLEILLEINMRIIYQKKGIVRHKFIKIRLFRYLLDSNCKIKFLKVKQPIKELTANKDQTRLVSKTNLIFKIKLKIIMKNNKKSNIQRKVILKSKKQSSIFREIHLSTNL
jgi:hypothetical protein